MPEEVIKGLTEDEEEELLKKLELGMYKEMEELVFKKANGEAVRIIKELVVKLTRSQRGLQIARQLQKEHGLKILRKVEVDVNIKSGVKIRVPSWYSLPGGKKQGRFKKGPNGRGKHLLLGYWGYANKWSPGYVDQVSRSGVASASYELASQDLAAQGVKIAPNGVDYMVQKVGEMVAGHRDKMSLSKGESLSGKRVVISIDGGRVRTRERKVGRRKKGQRHANFETPWREPKLLVIAELDEKGRKKRKCKPIYEATMGSPEDLYGLLKELCINLYLKSAKEIVAIGDGAGWIWNLIERLSQEMRIKGKLTEIVDWYHAVEHLSSIVEAHTRLTEKERQIWLKKLKSLLRAGKHRMCKLQVEKATRTHKLPELSKRFSYFDNHWERMRYDRYEKNQQPIGSGIVENAIKRVINSRLKSTGTFWKLENVEKILPLRCILLSGRWKIFMNNFIQIHKLKLAPVYTS
jgi:hypothetical protein